MPSGRVHDRVTLWTLPFITLLVGAAARSTTVALAVGGAYLFSGLMFGGDLDTRSLQYQRWLWLRWLWIPYRRTLRHRSIWSHGPIVGTTLRLLYLSVWVLGIGAIGTYARYRLGYSSWAPLAWGRVAWQWLGQPVPDGDFSHGILLGWTCLGLELGAMSHSLSDWTVSAWKRHRKVAQRARSGK
ncbi:MAG: metal-binding protein [Cyanobacteria bacterium P01_F01_bin.33]